MHILWKIKQEGERYQTMMFASQDVEFQIGTASDEEVRKGKRRRWKGLCWWWLSGIRKWAFKDVKTRKRRKESERKQQTELKEGESGSWMTCEEIYFQNKKWIKIGNTWKHEISCISSTNRCLVQEKKVREGIEWTSTCLTFNVFSTSSSHRLKCGGEPENTPLMGL